MVSESSNILKNLNQVRRACVDAGYARPSYDRLNKAVDERALPQRRGGGWTVKTVMQWASTCLERVLIDGPIGDKPALSTVHEQGNAEVRAQAQTRLLNVKAEREQLRLEKERGKWLPREGYERDLAARMAFFSNQIDALAVRMAEDAVEAVLGTDLSRAREIVDLVKDKDEPVEALVGFVQKVLPEIAALIMARKRRWLNAFAFEHVQNVDLAEILEAQKPGEPNGQERGH